MIDRDPTVPWTTDTVPTAGLKTARLASLLKWAGGKEQELKHILPLIPPFHRYYEPFVGGGAVFFSIQSHEKLINDRSTDLINLYRMVAVHNEQFFVLLHQLLYAWHALSALVESEAQRLIHIYSAYSSSAVPFAETKQALDAFVLDHQA